MAGPTWAPGCVHPDLAPGPAGRGPATSPLVVGGGDSLAVAVGALPGVRVPKTSPVWGRSSGKPLPQACLDRGQVAGHNGGQSALVLPSTGPTVQPHGSLACGKAPVVGSSAKCSQWCVKGFLCEGQRRCWTQRRLCVFSWRAGPRWHWRWRQGQCWWRWCLLDCSPVSGPPCTCLSLSRGNPLLRASSAFQGRSRTRPTFAC